MRKRILTVLLSALMMLTLFPFTAFAADDADVIEVDVSQANGNYDGYKIDDAGIKILNSDYQYVLSGSTDKPIMIWGDDTAYHFRLNNVTANGGIISQSIPTTVQMEVTADTENTFGQIKVNDLTMSGSGTVHASLLTITQSGGTGKSSGLHITDTTVIVNNVQTSSSTWEGTVLLDGAADVTITSTGDYAALKVGQDSAQTANVTLQDSASLKCLNQNMDESSEYAVDGIQMWNGASLLLKGNSYLEAEGKKSSSEYGQGSSISCQGNITVQDQAKMNLTAYDYAIYCNGTLTVNGGIIQAKSHDSYGIFAVNGLSASNCIIDADVPENYYGICSNGTLSVSQSWIRTTGKETISNVSDSAIIYKNKGTVVGDLVLPGDVTVDKDMELTIPEETSITVPSGVTFTNHGMIDVVGQFINAGGNIICDSHVGGTSTCTERAKCVICGQEYGDSPSHHLLKTEAKNPTCTENGNTEYWYCDKCQKYFSDETAETEITLDKTVIPATGHDAEIRGVKESTCTAEGYTGDKICKVCGEVLEKGEVIPKLMHNYKDGKCTVCGEADPNYQPDTESPDTDDYNMMLWIVLLFAFGGVLGTITIIKKKRQSNEINA